MVGDVQIGRVKAACVVNPVFPAPVVLQHPFTRLHEVTEVRSVTVLKPESKLKICKHTLNFMFHHNYDLGGKLWFAKHGFLFFFICHLYSDTAEQNQCKQLLDRSHTVSKRNSPVSFNSV